MRRLAVLLLALSLGACVHAQTLTVLAAASLRESFTELARSFEQTHSGVHVRLSFAGSQQLAATILLDAPADVFASADEVQMGRVSHAGKASTVKPLCSNRLVIAVAKDARGRIHSLSDLGGSGLRLVLAKPSVPVGNYTEQVLNKLPRGQASAIRSNVVSREPDVRTVLTRVALGEADAGVVYATDVAAAGKGVSLVEIPSGLQTPVTYEVTTLKRSLNQGLAKAFMDLVLSAQGQGVLRRHGFVPIHRR